MGPVDELFLDLFGVDEEQVPDEVVRRVDEVARQAVRPSTVWGRNVEEKDPKLYWGLIRSEDALKEAAKNGWEVVVPGPDQLQVDLDGRGATETFIHHLQVFHQYLEPVRDVRVRQSKSGRPWRLHCTITLTRPVSDIERIAFQACLGSDLKRELLSLVRVRIGDDQPTKFFELPDGT